MHTRSLRLAAAALACGLLLPGCDVPAHAETPVGGNRTMAVTGTATPTPAAAPTPEVLPPADAAVPAAPRTTTPAELVGDWKFGIGSFTNFFGPQGQFIGSGGGTFVRWGFTADGHYTQQVYLRRRNYNAVIETWTETTGTVTFGDGSLTIRPTQGRYRAADSLVDRNNFDRSMTEKERKDFVKTFLWKFERNADDGKRYLMIGFAENTWSHFTRAE